MQVARLVEPKPRTLWAKFVEMFRAAQLETRRTKDEILTAYLNLARSGATSWAWARLRISISARPRTGCPWARRPC